MTTATKKRRKTYATKPPVDIYQTVTDNIVKALENATGNNWVQPWQAIASGPRNISTKNFYKGINILQLAITALDRGYASPWWGTYDQWKKVGGQVRKGEVSTYSVFYKSYKKDVEVDGETKSENRRVARSNPLFNIAQVDGVQEPATEAPRIVGERVQAADEWITATGAAITYGGNRAYYTSAADAIACPNFSTFDSPAGFYSTNAHELGHWTGHETRLNRQLGNRFGSEQYAVEELIAELCSAFSCARLGIESVPREDHAEYLANWLKVLKSDNRAIFTAAAAAQRACDFLFNEEGNDE